MVRRYISAVAHWLKRVVTQPREELDRWQKAVRFMYDLGRHGADQLREDRAPQIAAALSFRALFALFPVLVVSTVLVRAMIGIEEFLGLVDSLFTLANLNELRIVLPAGTTGGAVTLRVWLDTLIGEAATINLTAVGWVGLVIVVYAAIGLMVTIENAFNTVYRAPEGRAWTRRVPLYWFVLTVSPIAIGLAAYVNGRFEGWIESVGAWQWALVIARILWSCLFGWLFMLAAYTLIPNTAVELRPAAIGSLVSIILLQIGLRTLGAYFENAFSLSRLYGSLGLIPLFMFWVYLMWLAVLFGLEVSATLQMLRGRKLEEVERKRELAGLVEPASVVTVMEIIAERFASGRHATLERICEQTLLPRSTAQQILDRLIEAGLVHRVGESDQTVCLAKPPDRITVAELIDIGFHLADEGASGRQSRVLEELRETQKRFASEIALAALMPGTQTQSSATQQSTE